VSSFFFLLVVGGEGVSRKRVVAAIYKLKIILSDYLFVPAAFFFLLGRPGRITILFAGLSGWIRESFRSGVRARTEAVEQRI